MLFTLLKSYAIWLLVSVLVCTFGIAVTAIFDPSQARTLLISYLYFWNGLLVAMSGCGALHFTLATIRQKFNFLIFGILSLSEDLQVYMAHQLQKLFSISNKNLIALPVFFVGSMILYICGYPMTGFPKYYLWITSSSMFYVGGLLLAYAIYSVHIFNCLEKQIDNVGLQDNVNIVELENFNFYISILFFSAIVALYFSFRGTLTANFTFSPPHQWIENIVHMFMFPGGDYASVRNLLLYPIILFLPLSLFAGFYMKYVIRRIYLGSIKRKISEIDVLAKPIISNADLKNSEIAVIEVRRAAMELKEKIIQNNRVLPMVTIKDSPSIFLSIIIFLQFIWINDTKVKEFIENFIYSKN